MPRLRDILARFRPAGAPGAAAAGVPADRSAELDTELRSVLDHLGRAQEEAHRIRATARDEAAAIVREAADTAQRIVAVARAEAPRVRAEAEAEARQESAAETARVGAEAEEETRAMRAAVTERMPAVVELLAERAATVSSAPGGNP